MKVKVGNNIYDSNDTPIMLILTDEDKENIRNMARMSTKFCSYPEEMGDKEIQEFMEVGNE